MSAGGFGSRWQITYQEIDFGPERLDPSSSSFSGNGKFLAPARLERAVFTIPGFGIPRRVILRVEYSFELRKVIHPARIGFHLIEAARKQ